MDSEELGGSIYLEGLDLDTDEKIVARKIVSKYAEKIGYLVKYQSIKIEMRTHKKGKNNHFEVKGLVIFDGGKVDSEKIDINPFVAISEVMEKMHGEIQHKIKNPHRR